MTWAFTANQPRLLKNTEHFTKLLANKMTEQICYDLSFLSFQDAHADRTEDTLTVSSVSDSGWRVKPTDICFWKSGKNSVSLSSLIMNVWMTWRLIVFAFQLSVLALTPSHFQSPTSETMSPSKHYCKLQSGMVQDFTECDVVCQNCWEFVKNK